MLSRFCSLPSTISSTMGSPLTTFLPSILRQPLVNQLASASLSTSAALKFNSRLTSPHNFPQPKRQKPDPFNGRQEMAKDGYGITLFDINEGKRESLGAVVMRFKRLDWGAWIRFDRAVTSDIKEIRHIPDDPYKVYNDMSWQNYHSTKLKNMELIKKYGAKNYNFHQYRAHYHGIIRKVDKTYNPFYEPPGYHADIAFGVYQPDSQKPQDEMPPDYLLERRNASKVLMAVEEKYLRQLRRGEHWYGRLGPCSPLRLPLAGTKLG